MREAHARVVELDDALPDGRLERLEDPLAVAVRGRDELDRRPGERRRSGAARRASLRAAGRDGRRAAPAGSPGTRSAWPGAGRVPVRTSSRPSSSAKNGLPAVASCTRASSGRVSSSPSRSSSRLWSAPRLSGPSASRSSRSSGNERSSSNGVVELGAQPQGRQQRRPARRAGAGARSGARRRRPGRATARRRARRGRALLGQRPQHVEHGEPDRVRIGGVLARLGEQQRDLERPPARRHERGADLVEHVAEQLGERRRRRATPRPRLRGRSEHGRTLRRASSTPASQRIVLPIPASPERTSAPGPCVDVGRGTPRSRRAPRPAPMIVVRH